MKYISIIFPALFLIGCSDSPKCTSKAGNHTFSKWSDSGGRRIFDNAKIMQRTCDTCGWIEEKLLN